MNKMQKIAAGLVGTICLSACASLEVQVDIMNPVETKRLAFNSELMVDYYDILGSDSQSVTQTIGALRARHLDANVEFAQKYTEAADQLEAQSGLDPDLLKDDCSPAAATASRDPAAILAAATPEANRALAESCLLDQIASDQIEAFDPGRTLDTLYNRYLATMLAQNKSIYDLIAIGEAIDQNNQPTPLLRSTLEIRRAALEPIRTAILADLAESEHAVELSVGTLSQNDETKQVTTEVQERWQTITGGRSLATSSYAYAVASADETYWANDFNKAFGNATFGNSDIVVKLDRAGEFTVKGMQFDPSAVAAVASKVTVQSLLLAAQISGVPVASADLPEAQRTVGFGGTGDSLAEDQQTLLQRQAAQGAREDALRGFARAILAEENGLNATGANADETRGAAIQAISDYFEANAALMSMSEVE